jgi:Transport and Golgi organisation 2
MCTVTYIPGGNGICFTSNRDERSGRAAALEPAIYEASAGNLMYPKDLQAGGTWFVVHENRQVLVLLNGGRVRHVPQGPYPKSRGLILLELADSKSPLHRFKTLDLEGIEPFTVVLLEGGELHECRWDGANKDHREQDQGAPHIWSSVTLYDPEVIRRRRVWFEDWLHENPDPDQDAILRFHRFTGDGDGRNDLLMNRDNEVLTVSITSVRCVGEDALMTYLDIRGGRTTRMELKLVDPPKKCRLTPFR